MYSRARYGDSKPSTASMREYAFHPVCVMCADGSSVMCRCMAFSSPGVTRNSSDRSLVSATPPSTTAPTIASGAMRRENAALARSGSTAAMSTVVSPPNACSRNVTTSAPSEAPSRSAKYSDGAMSRRR